MNGTRKRTKSLTNSSTDSVVLIEMNLPKGEGNSSPTTTNPEGTMTSTSSENGDCWTNLMQFIEHLQNVSLNFIEKNEAFLRGLLWIGIICGYHLFLRKFV
uniref:Uncharacterized protein n=1 Tax=Meloidogyne incognita TaxID=6306 RepID=A0A914MSS3_MELIC